MQKGDKSLDDSVLGDYYLARAALAAAMVLGGKLMEKGLIPRPASAGAASAAAGRGEQQPQAAPRQQLRPIKGMLQVPPPEHAMCAGVCSGGSTGKSSIACGCYRLLHCRGYRGSLQSGLFACVLMVQVACLATCKRLILCCLTAREWQ